MAGHAHPSGHDSSPSLDCYGRLADESARCSPSRSAARMSGHALTESVMPAAPCSYIPRLRAPATTQATGRPTGGLSCCSRVGTPQPRKRWWLLPRGWEAWHSQAGQGGGWLTATALVGLGRRARSGGGGRVAERGARAPQPRKRRWLLSWGSQARRSRAGEGGGRLTTTALVGLGRAGAAAGSDCVNPASAAVRARAQPRRGGSAARARWRGRRRAQATAMPRRSHGGLSCRLRGWNTTTSGALVVVAVGVTPHPPLTDSRPPPRPPPTRPREFSPHPPLTHSRPPPSAPGEVDTQSPLR